MRPLPSSASTALHCQRGDISKVFESLQDLTWTALFLAYHQPRPVAGLRQHALSVRLNQMKMGSILAFIIISACFVEGRLVVGSRQWALCCGVKVWCTLCIITGVRSVSILLSLSSYNIYAGLIRDQ